MFVILPKWKMGSKKDIVVDTTKIAEVVIHGGATMLVFERTDNPYGRFGTESREDFMVEIGLGLQETLDVLNGKPLTTFRRCKVRRNK